MRFRGSRWEARRRVRENVEQKARAVLRRVSFKKENTPCEFEPLHQGLPLGSSSEGSELGRAVHRLERLYGGMLITKIDRAA